MVNQILKYFGSLPKEKCDKLNLLKEIYSYWNHRINIISRKDLDNFTLHHVIHSLSISKIIEFKPGTKILDAGTGGGLPGIPLAIIFPEVS
ncbi:MAG TPA: 16S rRNA (guanine(527)-N(7))-methyltransferase RsmG, partial [Bacteroidales bacterium]|nr:16S rRNA (guanine(527)-N(7))-methyltransferase RsmG [Bacteroidales bacterium]